MNIIEISSNKFGFEGSISYLQRRHKSVEVDGEVYTKNWAEDVTKTIRDIKKDHSFYFHEFKYDFNAIDYQFTIEECTGFHNNLSGFIMNYSQNGYVNALICAYESGVLDSKIKNVFTDKVKFFINDWDSIISTSKVDLFYGKYGFNNGIYYSISLYELFKMKYKKIPKDIVDIFNEHGINLKSKNRLLESIKILNKKINRRQLIINKQNQ